MDAIKQQLLKVQQQLAGLSASQKMLTASLLVIMVMTLFYWSHFAGTSEMEAVIDKPLTTQELTDVKAAISAKGITYEVRGDRIYVPVGKKSEATFAMSDLALDGKLPAAYDKAADEAESSAGNILESPAAREQRLQDGRRKRVEGMISRWPNVTRADVIITGEKRTGILRAENPSASVSLTMSDISEVKRIVQAARTLVARAQAGMKPEDVGIVVNGKEYKPEDANNPFGENGILATKMQYEKAYIEKILQQLQDIPNVRATVSIDLETKTSTKTAYTVDPKGKVEALLSSETTSQENAGPPPAAEPGMTSNIGGLSVDNASAAKSGSTSETTKIQNKVDTSYVQEQTQAPAGTSVVKMASVRLPESYFRKIWKAKNPKATNDPSDVDIQLLVDRAKPDILANVKSATAIADDKLVSVTTYPDFDLTPAPEASSALAAMPMTSGFGAKEIAVGALALISLFMVSMMVRKSTPAPIVVTPTTPPPPVDHSATLLPVNNIAGEVSEGALTLAGQELTDEAIEAKQVIEQVGTMVKQNPEVAANLVKRWLNQE